MDTVNLREAVMQSFTSIGPMLDFIALFSIIALYSGSMLPFVVIFSFLLSYFTLYTIYSFASVYVTNGGYYSYAGNGLGKGVGFLVLILYIGYSVLTVPNISIFISGFLYSIMGIFGFHGPYMEYAFLLAFTAAVYLVVSRGLRASIRYTLIAGFLEIAFVISMSIIFIIFRSPGFSFSGIKFSFNPFFFGVIFGILAFSGGGSSIFLSEETSRAHMNTPKSLLISFTISGLIMVFSAFALLIFAGYQGLSLYESNSFYITELVRSRLGVPFLAVFSIFGLISAFNLSVSYLNAFVHMMPKFYNDFNINKNFSRNKFMAALFTFSIIISLIAIHYAGFFNSFVIIAGLISFMYIIIHIISNISLIRIFRKQKFFIPLISSLILSIAFILSFYGNTGYFAVINYLLIAYIMFSIIFVIYIKKAKHGFYNNIKFEYSDSLNTSAVNHNDLK
ncbi:APC family permease [Ferroplasma sp.]|uniref:APC family permease n=1 Tax=Ferroplasma sp. TaxID=2591003 RepID=UPI002634845F|nr:APC family permease [Ferroplasma sp.]